LPIRPSNTTAKTGDLTVAESHPWCFVTVLLRFVYSSVMDGLAIRPTPSFLQRWGYMCCARADRMPAAPDFCPP
jgi:hypothetical protein